MVISFKKIRLKINYSFILIVSLSLLSESDNVLIILIFSSLHEIGHLILLIAFGARELELTLSYYGVALDYKNELSFYRELFFLLGGITVNAVFVLLNIYRDINLLLLMVNILPVYPLDGGRALKLILDKAFGINPAYKVFGAISVFAVILILVSAIYFKNYSLLLIAAYIIAYSLNN